MKIISLKTIALLLVTSINYTLNAQDWVVQFPGTNFSHGEATASDSDGNIYTVGSFKDTIDVDPSNAENLLVAAGYDDAFIQKLDEQSNFLWSLQIGAEQIDKIVDLSIDSDNNIYVTGSFWGTVDFNPNGTAVNLNSGTYNDVFIAKYNTNGLLIWVKQLASDIGIENYDMVIDSTDNIYVTGQFFGTVDINPGTATENITSTGADDSFVLKLNNQGNYLQHLQIKGSWTASNKVMGITVDENQNMYVTGIFDGTTHFDAVTSLNSTGYTNSFTAKYNADGTLNWAKKFTADEEVYSNNLGVDENGNSYVSGYFYNATNLDPGNTNYTISNTENYDAFIVKLSANGDFVCAKQITGSNNAFNFEIAVDASSNIVATGRFNGVTDFGTDSLYTASANGDAYVLRMDTTCNTEEIIQISKISGATSLGVDAQKNVLITGSFTETPSFWVNQEQVTLNSSTVRDGFLYKIASEDDCAASFSAVEVTSCQNYNSPSGILYLTTGVYTDTIATVNGCDSIITIDLTIENFEEILITQADNVLEVATSYQAIQWFDCENTSIINGEVSTSFSPTNSGEYAVINNGTSCVDTSDCFLFQMLALEEENQTNLEIYPNPTARNFYVNSDKELIVGIKLIDHLGRTVFVNNQLNTNSFTGDIIGENGIYFLQVSFATATKSYKIVLEN